MIDGSLAPWLTTLIHGAIVLVFMVGLLRFFIHRDFIRQIVGLKLMLQSVSLGLVFVGWQSGDLRLAQGMVISALIIEAVVISLALTMIVHIHQHQEEDTQIFEHLKKRVNDHE